MGVTSTCVLLAGTQSHGPSLPAGEAGECRRPVCSGRGGKIGEHLVSLCGGQAVEYTVG